MIKQVAVNNYKNLNNFNFGGFGRINLLTGKNNIGKTNLLESIYIGLHPSSKGFIDICEARQVKISAKNFAILDNIFSNLRERYIEIAIDGVLSRIDMEDIDASRLGQLESKMDAESQLSHLLEQLESSLIRKISSKTIHFLKDNKEIASIFPTDTGIIQKGQMSDSVITSVAYIPSNYKASGKELSDVYSEIARNKVKKQNLMQSLKDCLKLEIEDVSILTDGGEPNIHLSIFGSASTMPLQYFGDATRKSFDILMKCMSLDGGGVALIDEVENGLHYKNQQDFWSTLNEISKQTSCQIIATTHSLEMINAFYKATKDEEDCRLLKMYRDRKSANMAIQEVENDLLEYELRKISGLYDVDVLR